MLPARWTFALFAPVLATLGPSPYHAPKLHLEEVGSDSTSFDVVATLIVGP